MSFFLLLLFLIIPLSFSGAHLYVINVTESNELEHFLCYNDPPVVGDTLVVLSTNITHYISGNVSFCMINTTYSLNITSNSSGPATINCNQTGNHSFCPTTGFSFINVRSLTLQRLVFRGCGSFLKNSTIIDVINSTECHFHFTQYQSAVLLFPHIHILLIQNVNITYYYGFAILAINPVNAIMKNLIVKSNILINSCKSRSILLCFTDENICSNIPHTVVIKKSFIMENCGISNGVLFLRNIKEYFTLSASGLTVLYFQTQYIANVSIIDTEFIRNSGITLFLLHFKTNYGTTAFDHVSFVSNLALSVVLLIMIEVSDANSALHFNNSVFNGTLMYGPQSSSAVSIGLYNPSLGSAVDIHFTNSVFTKNTATTSGSCIYAIDTGIEGEVLNIYLKNIIAHDNFKFIINDKFGNTMAELIKLDNAKGLHISGYNNFSHNFGSVFGITNTIIHLNGQLNIIGNNGYMGTGFKVQGLSYFLLSNGLNATFINNTALTIGGAIYAVADVDFKNCMFQNNAQNITNIKMKLINNAASEAGSSIYSNNLYGCDTDNGRLNLMNRSISSIIFSFYFSKHQNISMPPTSLRLCNVPCNAFDVKNENKLSAFIRPGQNTELQLAAVGNPFQRRTQFGYATVTFLLIDRNNVHSTPSWQVSANSANQALLEKQDCTSVTITLLKNKNELNPSSPAIIVSVH